MNILDELLLKKVLQLAIDHLGFHDKVTPEEILKVMADLKDAVQSSAQGFKLAAPNEKVSVQEIILIMQAVCAVIQVLDTEVCPFVNDLMPKPDPQPPSE